MYIHLGFIKHQIKQRKYLPNHYSELGSILKHKRMEMNLTLEEGAEGICSISYLSKIENNLIKPNQKYIDSLRERYLIDLNEENDVDHFELINLIIDSFFYDLEIKLDENIINQDNFYAKLYKFSVELNNKNYFLAKKTFFELNPYIKNMKDLELNLYLYLTSLILKEEGRVKDAHSILNYHNPKKLPERLLMLIDQEKIITSCLVNNHMYLMLNYDNYLNNLLRKEHYHMAHKVKFNYLIYLSKFINYNELKKVADKHINIHENEKNYVFALNHYINGKYDEAKAIMENFYKENNDYYMLYIYILNKKGEHSEIKQLLKNKINTSNISYNLVFEFLNIKNFKTEDVLLDYLRNQLIKSKELPETKIELEFLYNESLKVLKKNGFYKDATNFAILVNDIKNDLNSY